MSVSEIEKSMSSCMHTDTIRNIRIAEKLDAVPCLLLGPELSDVDALWDFHNRSSSTNNFH